MAEGAEGGRLRISGLLSVFALWLRLSRRTKLSWRKRNLCGKLGLEFYGVVTCP